MLKESTGSPGDNKSCAGADKANALPRLGKAARLRGGRAGKV